MPPRAPDRQRPRRVHKADHRRLDDAAELGTLEKRLKKEHQENAELISSGNAISGLEAGLGAPGRLTA